MATEKISLFDSTQDIMVEVNVSAEDAQRAVTDQVFARRLLDKVLKEHPQPSTSDDDENGTNNAVNVEFLDPEETGDLNLENQESEGSLYRWSQPCVLFLLETYMSMEREFNCGKLTQKQVWEKISKQLKEKGYDVTGPQCSSKFRSLKKSYRSIRDHNNKSGKEKRYWQYFDIMEGIFTKKGLSRPAAAASSTKLKSKQAEQNESMEKSDSRCSITSNKKISSLLGKRLKQREEHEQLKMKRHKERVEMDQKFLKVLEKLANN